MTMGMSTACFVHAVVEVRITAVASTDGRPSLKFAGSCAALREEGVSEIHTFLYDAVLTYTGRWEFLFQVVRPPCYGVLLSASYFVCYLSHYLYCHQCRPRRCSCP